MVAIWLARRPSPCWTAAGTQDATLGTLPLPGTHPPLGPRCHRKGESRSVAVRSVDWICAGGPMDHIGLRTRMTSAAQTSE